MSEATKDPTWTALVALIVGLLVRMLRARKFEEWIELVPWLRPIPKPYVPWIALSIGVVITAADARLNGGLTTWREALVATLQGLFAGGLAIAGHETIIKTPQRVREYRESMRPKPMSVAPPPLVVPPSAPVPKPDDDVHTSR